MIDSNQITQLIIAGMGITAGWILKTVISNFKKEPDQNYY